MSLSGETRKKDNPEADRLSQFSVASVRSLRQPPVAEFVSRPTELVERSWKYSWDFFTVLDAPGIRSLCFKVKDFDTGEVAEGFFTAGSVSRKSSPKGLVSGMEWDFASPDQVAASCEVGA